MDTFLTIDDYMNDLSLIREYMKDWVEIDEYSLLFESDSDPVVKAQAKNEEVSQKSSNVLSRMIQGVINMIKSLIESITNFFEELTLDGDEKDAFQNFKEQMKNDPKLKNVKVTVKDFRQINKEYDALLKKGEEELRKAKADENHGLSGIIKEFEEATKKKIEPASLIVTSELALKIAESDQNSARALKVALNHDKAFMEQLEKNFGKREANKFKKRIDNASEMTVLTRLMITLRGTRCKNIQTAVRSTTEGFVKGGFINPFKRPGKLMWKNKETREINKTVVKSAGSALKGGVQGVALGVADKHGNGKKVRNPLERKIDKEKKNLQHSKSFWTGESVTIDSDLRDEILDMSNDDFSDF